MFSRFGRPILEISRRHGRTLIAMGMQPALQLVALAMVAAHLDLSSAGVFFAATALAPFAAEIVGLGCGEASVRSVGRGERTAREAIGGFLIYAMATLPAVALAYALLVWLPSAIAFPFLLAILFAVLELSANRMCAFVEHLGVACNRIGLADVARIGVPIGRLAGIAAAVHLDVLSPFDLAVWFAAGSFVAAAATFVLMIAVVGLPDMRRPLPLSQCVAFLGSQLARSAQQNLDRYVAALVLAPSAIALFTVGQRGILAATLPVQAVARNTYRKFFSSASEGRDAVVAHGWSVARLTTLLGIAAGACVPLVAQAVPLALGPQYEAAAEVMIWLAGVPVLYAWVYAAGNVLSGLDRQWTRTACGVAALAAQLIAVTTLTTSLSWGILVIGTYIGLAVNVLLLYLAIKLTERDVIPLSVREETR